jgi:hypothetical protein
MYVQSSGYWTQDGCSLKLSCTEALKMRPQFLMCLYSMMASSQNLLSNKKDAVIVRDPKFSQQWREQFVCSVIWYCKYQQLFIICIIYIYYSSVNTTILYRQRLKRHVLTDKVIVSLAKIYEILTKWLQAFGIPDGLQHVPWFAACV